MFLMKKLIKLHSNDDKGIQMMVKQCNQLIQ